MKTRVIFVGTLYYYNCTLKMDYAHRVCGYLQAIYFTWQFLLSF